MVLLKGVDERGFAFYTNYQSAKAEQIAAHPQAALCFLWKTAGASGVQVRVEGEDRTDLGRRIRRVFRLARARQPDWRMGFAQSQTLPGRGTFYERIAEFEKKFDGGPCRVRRIGAGTALRPDLIEFWYGQRARLHERDRYELRDGRWSKRMLYP